MGLVMLRARSVGGGPFDREGVMNHSRIGLLSLLLLVSLALAGCGDEITYYGDDTPYYPIESSSQVVYQAGDAIEYLYYGTLVCADGTYDMSGWFTIMVSAQGITNPMNDTPVLTLIENQDMAINFAGNDGTAFTMTVNDYAYRYFIQDPANGTMEYYGDKIRDDLGEFFTVWFETPYIPITSPFSVGQYETDTYDRYIEDDGSTSYLDTHTTTVAVTGEETVPTPLGDFQTYVMSWNNDDEGVLVRYQFVYPGIGIVKFIFPTLQPGCSGDIIMDMLDTNISFGGETG